MLRVFMLCRLPLFSQGVQALLCQQPGVEIVGRANCVEQGIEQIIALEPDVIILDDELQGNESTTIALQLLEHTQAKIIGLSLASNTIYIYRKEQRTAHDIRDLMEAIKNNQSEPVSNSFEAEIHS